MHRLLATIIFAYALLSAALWRHAAGFLYAPPDILWCGNVISDPLTLLVNVVGPMAALCAAVLARQSIKSRRWPCYSIMALATFAVTSACLGYEVYSLGDYGIEIGCVWWLPWR